MGVLKVFLDDNAITNSHDFKFQANSSGELHAANEITLNPGFEAQINATFAARIGTCDESALKAAQEAVENSLMEDGLFNIYPNPAADLITVEMKLKSFEPYILIIRDIAGRTLHQSNNANGNNDFIRESFSVNTFADGMYVVEVKQSGERWIEKFMVQH
ncbi:MAG: T9SS type A sorting domain-containing protein [Chitinophagales bacterium]